MVSTSKVPGFIGPPEFRGRTRPASEGDAGTIGSQVQAKKAELREGDGNNGIGRHKIGQPFGHIVLALAHGWKTGETPETETEAVDETAPEAPAPEPTEIPPPGGETVAPGTSDADLLAAQALLDVDPLAPLETEEP